MNPHEILEELDRLGVTIWYVRYGAQLDYQAQIRHESSVPPELAQAISENREMLIRIGGFRPGDSPGMYYRPPKTRGS